jgi:hypothetical protein
MSYLRVAMTYINQRDSSILQLVTRFHQLTTTQINELVFAGLSPMPCHRALRRLVAHNFLMRVERRVVGGQRGGSGQYVYQLGREGHREHGEGTFRPWATVSLHTLAVADAYLSVVRLSRQGLVTIDSYSTEPDCHETIGRYDLRPDLFVDVIRAVNGERLPIWFEVDRGTERPIRIKAKLERYYKARQARNVEEWPIWPVTVWLAHTDRRATELRKIVSQVLQSRFHRR